MWNDDDIFFTPLGHAYDDFKHAIEALQRRWHHDRQSRHSLDRAAREICGWMDRALGALDDLYNGDDDLLDPHAAFEQASYEQRTLAYETYKKTLAFRMYLIQLTGEGGADERAREHAGAVTDVLLDQLTPFVSRASDAGRRVLMGDVTMHERLHPELALSS